MFYFHLRKTTKIARTYVAFLFSHKALRQGIDLISELIDITVGEVVVMLNIICSAFISAIHNRFTDAKTNRGL